MKLIKLFVIFILIVQLSFTCDEKEKEHNKHREKYFEKKIEIVLNPNKSQEFIYPIRIDKKLSKELLLEFDASGFVDSLNEKSEELSKAISYYLVDLKNPNKILVEINKSEKYNNKYFNNRNIALKIIYDISKIDGKWYKIKSGTYSNRVNISLNEYEEYKDGRNIRIKSNQREKRYI